LEIIKQLRDDLQKKADEMNKFMVENKISVKGEDNSSSQSSTQQSSSGILV
jgi:hypothetical protein